MKIALELNIVDDVGVFLNYWNAMTGDDVICEIVKGKLMLHQYDDKANELPNKEITISEFIEMVKKNT